MFRSELPESGNIVGAYSEELTVLDFDQAILPLSLCRLEEPLFPSDASGGHPGFMLKISRIYIVCLGGCTTILGLHIKLLDRVNDLGFRPCPFITLNLKDSSDKVPELIHWGNW